MYYLRTKSAVDAIKFTVNQQALEQDIKHKQSIQNQNQSMKEIVCSLDNKENCETCSS